jgi:ATP-dependent helicase HrpB
VSRLALPVDALLPDLLAALRAGGAAVVRAPTGSGKTTRVPPALLDALPRDRHVLVLQPRRLAARAAARRIAEERGGTLGDEVGYAVRFDRRAGPRTRLLVVTEGLLIRMLQEDPLLSHAGAVVLDEFHERHLDSDLSLALLQRVRAARPELWVVAMSASDLGPRLPAFLGGAPLVACEGRLFPVETRWRRTDRDEPLPRSVAAGVADALAASPGDVLVFLPGVGEIRRCAEELSPLAARAGAALTELYGDLPAERQDEALRAGPRRRIILATNVAETSVTVEGVTAVVDSGLQRQLRFDPSVGLDRLELVRISRASAEQRAGRAGRTAPGVCVRLWSEHEQRALVERDEPEVLRVDLAGPALQLLAWGERDLFEFPWLQPPPRAALEEALALLARLGATGAAGLTAEGRAMSRLPVHPRLARLLLEAARRGVPEAAAMAAALLSERDPFLRGAPGPGARAPTHVSRSDVADRVAALLDFERRGLRHSELGELHQAGARAVLRARDQLLGLLREAREPARAAAAPDADEALGRALLAAFPDRLARRREAGSPRAVMVGGRGVTLDPRSGVRDAPLFLALDLDARAGGDALVRLASEARREWLAQERLATRVDVAFDARALRVGAVRRVVFEDLALEESPAALPDGEEVARCLAAAAAERLDEALPLREPETEAWLARVRWLAERRPDLGLPVFDESGLRAALPALCAGCRSFEELRKLRLAARLADMLPPAQRAALDRLAPERLAVPSGSHVRLDYQPGRAPVLAVRMQELFGLSDTPRVLGGGARVLLHLLAPNGRPEQVTEDLASFWANVYPQARRELMRRYPRHAWPEDPLRAAPQRRPRPRAR